MAIPSQKILTESFQFFHFAMSVAIWCLYASNIKIKTVRPLPPSHSLQSCWAMATRSVGRSVIISSLCAVLQTEANDIFACTRSSLLDEWSKENELRGESEAGWMDGYAEEGGRRRGRRQPNRGAIPSYSPSVRPSLRPFSVCVSGRLLCCFAAPLS